MIVVRVGPFEVKYELGHSYEETWEGTGLYCPQCGQLEVWRNTNGGDYYEGEQHLCTSCESTFSLPRLHAALPDWQNEQRLAALRDDEAETVVKSDARKDR